MIDCGSKSEIPFMARICRALKIPVLSLHDEDLHEGTGDENTRAKIEASDRGH